MRIVLINMADQTRRLAFQQRQLGHLRLSFERFEAITPETLPPYYQAIDRTRWERTVTLAEMACLASHRTVWSTVAEGTDPVLVLEDDIVLAGALPDVLSDLEQRSDIEHLTFEVRRRKKLIAAEPAFTSGGIAMHRLWLDRSGAAGYVLWPAGARRLLAHSEGRPHLADGVICSCPDLLSYQAVPALALQADRCAVYGIPAPIDTSSSLVRPRGRKARKTGGQLMRRVAAQARSGARFGKMLGGAQRLHVPVDRAMFI